MGSDYSVSTTKNYGIKLMEVLDIVENEDGSATFTFDMTKEEARAMCINGIIWAVISGATGITAKEVIDNYLEENDAKEEE